MTNGNRRNRFPSIRLTALTLTLLAALLTFLSGGDNKAQAFTLGERMSGIEIGLDSNQGLPAGVWSDGTTVWALDSADTHLYAYTMNPEGTDHGDRDSDKDIDLHADNGVPYGIWSDGSTVWVSDSGADKLFAYKMDPGETDHGGRDSEKDIDLDSGNGAPTGIWAVSATLWVADNAADKVFAYTLSSGTRDAGKEFSLDSGNGAPTGIWSDGATLWVVDNTADKVFAYTLSSGTRDADKEFDLHSGNSDPTGAWSDGSTFWVSDTGGDRLYAYDISRTNPYFQIPESSHWQGIAGTETHLYLSDSTDSGKIRVFDSSDGSEVAGQAITLNSANDDVLGVWTDGTHLWAVEKDSTTLYAYNLASQAYASTENITLDSDNSNPFDLWGNDEKLYVLNNLDGAVVPKIYVYRRSDGRRVSDDDFDLHDDNDTPRGIWSDGVTMWVADKDEAKVFAYWLGGPQNGERRADKEFDLHDDNDNPGGMWSDGIHLHVVQDGDNTTTLYRYDVSDLLLPQVTLAVSPQAISENGGTATVSATLDRASSHATTITVSEDSDAVALSGNATLTIAANSTASTGVVTLTSVDDDVFTGNRFVAVSGSAVNTDGVVQPADARLVVRDDETLPIEDMVRKSGLDFTGLSTATNDEPWGIWSDGATMWVADDTDDKLYAYKMNPGQAGHGDRDTAKEFDLAAANADVNNIWSDGETLWALDSGDDKLFAYKMNPGGSDHGQRDADREFNLDSDNGNPTGVWSDGLTIWVVNDDPHKIFGYKMNPGGSDHGQRDADREFNLDSDNDEPESIWSDGTTMWVADDTDNKLYAYALSSGARTAGKDLALPSDNASLGGIFAYGPNLWVADWAADKLFAYFLPRIVTLEVSPQAISENGGTATVSATLDRASSHATTITVSEDSDAVSLSGNATLTIAANSTSSTGAVTLTGVDDDVFTGNRFVAVSGTAVNTDGVVQPADLRLVVRDDETLSIENMVRKSGLDFTGLATATNEEPWGIWSDGTTMWVADDTDDKLYAYRMNPGGSDHGDRDTAKEFDLAAANADVNNIWSDGDTLWALDSGGDKLFAYRMNPGGSDHGQRDADKEFNLDGDNGNPTGIWSDGFTIWVVNDDPHKIFGYKMNPGGSDHGDRDTAREFNLDSDNDEPESIWSDGETVWVTDSTDRKLYAYTLSNGTRTASRDLALPSDNASLGGMFAYGPNLWVADWADDKLFAYFLPHIVTLAVSPAIVSENGGTATVSATLNRVSSQATTITVSEDSDAVALSGNATLTIAANSTASTGVVTLAGVDDDVFTGNRFVAVSGSAVNTDSVEGPADVRLVVAEDETVPLQGFSSTDSSLDFSGLSAAGNIEARLTWSDGTTIWVSDIHRHKLYAYRMNPGGSDHGKREADKEFNLHADNRNASGMWSDGATIWVTDHRDDKLYAYRMNPGGSDHGERDAAREFNLHAVNGNATGIWSDGLTIWVADYVDRKLYAYRMNPGGSDHGERDADKEFNLHADNLFPSTVWSDGTTIWVMNRTGGKVFAYNLSTGAHNPDGDFTLNLNVLQDPEGIWVNGFWADGTALWIVHTRYPKIYGLSAPSPVPVFGEEIYGFSIAEDAATGTAVGSVSATHTDNAELTYTIEAGNGDGKFAINGNTGAIATAGALDQDDTESYTLTVQADDGNGGTATATVNVTVTEVNDDGPLTPPDPVQDLTATVVEGGIDFDWSHQGGVSEYWVSVFRGVMRNYIGSSRSSDFQWRPDGGLKCGTVSGHSVIAYGDGKKHSADGSPAVSIWVKAPTCPPSFGSATYGFSVAEDAAVGAAVGTVSATDPDNDTLIYTIEAGNGDGKFAIDGSSGAITTTEYLDHETTSSYALTVQADDGNGGTDTATVNVTVTDVNVDLTIRPTNLQGDNITHNSVDLSWDAPAGIAVQGYQILIRYAATDEAKTFHVLVENTQNTDTEYAVTGLDPETEHVFRVKAHTADGLTKQSSFLDVTTLAGPAFDSASYDFSVAEDAATGTAVGAVSATHSNNEALTYTIEAGNGDGKFAIDGSSGAITTAGALDHDVTESYTLTVQADDGSGGTDTATVNVTVTEVNDDGALTPPDPVQDLTATVVEGGIDFDWSYQEGVSEYWVTVFRGVMRNYIGSSRSSDFQWRPDGGLKCGTVSGHSVIAYGDDKMHSTAGSPAVSIWVKAPTCPPSFGSATYSFSIAEDAATGAAVGTVSATDPDNDTLTYTIEAGNGDGKFAIDGSSGAITTAEYLDHETDASYTLTVQADDGNGGTDTATVSVTVTDVNVDLTIRPTNLQGDNITHQGVDLSWDAPAGIAVQGYQILIRYDATDEAGTFNVLVENTQNTDTEYAVTGLDPETDHVFRVKAHTADGLSKWSSYLDVVTLPELRFDSPSYSFSIAENAATHAVVGTVSATDAQNDTLTYTIESGNGDGKFAIDGSSGAITTAGALDHDTAPSYTLTVQADDGNGDTAIATVSITVTDVAELGTGPLSGFTLVDASDQTVLATLADGGTVELADPDGGSYGIRADVDSNVTIGSVSLALSGAKTVSRTESSAPYSLYGDGGANALSGESLPAGSYTLTATAYSERNLDGNRLGTLEISFTVTQANRAPEFGSSTYGFSIAEDAAVGAAVGTVSATDPDNDGITYAIESGNGDGKFAINGSSGAITTAEYLDHETTSSYALTVQADDGNGGTATATVNVTVTDVNIDLTIRPNNLQGDNITHNSVDLSWDAPAGVAVRGYQILIRYAATDEAKTFHVLVENTQNTDTEYAVTGLDPETEHVFRVKAHTADGLTKWSSYLDVVTLPELRFDSPSYSFSIAENAATGAAVGTVSATDAQNDTLTYTIEAGNGDGKFAIDGSSGAITTAGALEHETTPSYTLTVQADDGNGDTTTATVSITVTPHT